MRLKLHARIAALVVFVITVLLLYRYAFQFERQAALPSPEFARHSEAAKLVQNGLNPYLSNNSGGTLDRDAYRFSPSVLAGALLLPKDTRQAWIWVTVLSSLCLGAGFLVGMRYSSWRSLLLLGIGLIGAWKGVLESLETGQLELMLWLIALTAGALRLRAPLLAGFVAGALPWIKIPWLLILLPLILMPGMAKLQAQGKKPRRVRLLISGFLFSAFVWGVAVPTITFGTDRSMLLTRSWMRTIVEEPQVQFFDGANQAFWLSVQRWIDGPLPLAIGLAAIATGLILGGFISRSLKIGANRDVLVWMTPWLILIQFLTPLSWRSGSVFLLGAPFAIAAVSLSLTENILRALLIFIAVALWALQLNPVAHWLGYSSSTAMHDYGLVTAYWGVILLLCLFQPSTVQAETSDPEMIS